MAGLERTMRMAKDKSVTECLELLFSESYDFTKGAGRHDDTSIMLLECD